MAATMVKCTSSEEKLGRWAHFLFDGRGPDGLSYVESAVLICSSTTTFLLKHHERTRYYLHAEACHR